MNIASSVGNLYEVVSVHGNVYRVANPETKLAVGYIAHASYGHISLNGPLAGDARTAASLARICAHNRYKGYYVHDTKNTR